MKIVLWKGYHSLQLIELLSDSLQGKQLCLLCPPHLTHYEFLNSLPKGEVSLLGDWQKEDLILAQKTAATRSFKDYAVIPQFGIFTSGTLSSTPKLVLFSKEQVEASVQSILDLFQPQWAEKIFCYPQPFHIFGLTLGYLHSLIWKKPFYPLEGRYQKSFHDLWAKEDKRGLLSLGAPVHFHDLLQSHSTKNIGVQKNSSSICGGARVSPELWDKFQTQLGIEYPSIGYGASEACPGLSHLPPGIKPQESGDIGNWLKGVEAQSLENGFEFKGPNQCQAMIEESTPGNFVLSFPKSIIIRDEIVQSGDRLIYKGRSDLKINRGGEKFLLEIIEEKIQHTLKNPVIAVALADLRLGEKLGLLIQSRSSSTELKQLCKTAVLQEFFWSLDENDIHVCSEFPTQANGKWDRKKALSYFT